jgi:hypothetical protein
VRLAVVRRPLAGQQPERGQPQAVQPIRRPPVAAVHLGIGVGGHPPLPGAGQQVGDVEAAARRLLEDRDGGRQRAAGCRADRRVVLAQQVLGLRRPRHQLGVQQHPVRAELGPQPGRSQRRAQPGQQRLGDRRRGERPAGPGGDRAGAAVLGTEPPCGDLGVRTDQHHGARAHVLLLAHHLLDPGLGVEVERLVRVLQQARTARGGHRRHGRRQVGQPAGVLGEPAHHLQRGGRVLGRDGHPAQVRGLDHPTAADVGQPELVIGAGRGGGQRPGRGVPDPVRGHVDQLTLGVAQRGEPAAEHAAGVDAQGVVDPLRRERRGVPVDHRGRPAVVVGPGQPHRQPVLVGLAGRVAVERERAHPARGPVVVPLDQPGVRHDQPALVQHQVGHQRVGPGQHLVAELSRLGLELGEGGLQPVRDLHRAPAQRPDQLLLVVAGDDQRMAGPLGPHHQSQHPDRVRPAVHQVTDQHDAPPGRVHQVDGPALPVPDHRVAEPVDQLEQLDQAAVHVTDEVERTVLGAPVAAQRHPLDAGRLDLLDPGQHVHRAQSLAPEPAQRAAQRGDVPPHHTRTELAVRPGGVAGHRDLLRHVQHDRDRQHVVLAREPDKSRPRMCLDVGRVDDGEAAAVQPQAGDVVQRIEGGSGRGLVVLVIGDHAPERVRGQHLGGPEVPRREGGLARPGRADQQHQAQVGDLQHAHATPSTTATGAARRNSASWVGGPTAGSSSPTPRSCTV